MPNRCSEKAVEPDPKVLSIEPAVDVFKSVRVLHCGAAAEFFLL
jgi:hypothetical protein